MKLDSKSLLLYAITDRAWLKGKTVAEAVEEAILGGATCIQLREKNLSDEEFLKTAMDVKAVTDKYNIPFIINDNVDIAVRVGADGAHIGQDDEEIKSAREKLGADKIIGLSAATVEEAVQAEQSGADYIGVGAVFNTLTKLDANTVSFETLKEICNTVKIPVVAIGGISKDNALQLAGTGIEGISVVSAIFAQNDIKTAASELLELAKKIIE
ncbi:MAG TPA: thiamine phosphate synthase [Sedimentibacter sp.]|nr:thiamine phosphate synthase [Sedimentibacter sp.]NLA13081.1 thiamine phosphate synthase [Tissierellia bacterium]HOA20578.1 thiamine phosphate synthase [Sedimentibacter sp.]HOG62292.1 thiamine phosphate synthase [Sedimentibacter sp.]HOT21767.1 thiamine phosphate synthase [Sedimentibacter sp.]